ncbi:hypothetical protein BOX15_Mlig029517g1 [Macrostomum lignano]|uniref:Protein FAM222B n=2 Tax=Macrostomum lignano TaxID=282301 RepID=A0A1I8GXH8_9PLAT|nr:hypothetical protein BOX15_Mlig029517g1 [Macrostomum lignano]
MSSGIQRPKTAGPSGVGLQQRTEAGGLPRRSGSQMSLRSTADASCWPQYVPIRRAPSAMKRNMEIQTDAALPPAMGVSAGQGTEADQPGGLASGGGTLFYPYYVPGVQSGPTAGNGQKQQQPFVLLSPWQLPGYQTLPVLDPAQLRLLEPALSQSRSQQQAHPLDGSPVFRSGRNGSCWRHVRQCTGNLGNNIMFIDGNVKEDDCRRFPPHGYPGAAGFGGLSVNSRLAPKVQPRNAAGIPLGSASRGDLYRSQALQRAKTGTKYWFEDRQPAPLVPNTIQGRIMKSGSAY